MPSSNPRLFSSHLALHQSLLQLDQQMQKSMIRSVSEADGAGDHDDVDGIPATLDDQDDKADAVVTKALQDYKATCFEIGKLVLDLGGLASHDFLLVLNALMEPDSTNRHQGSLLHLTEIDISLMASKEPILIDRLLAFLLSDRVDLSLLSSFSLTSLQDTLQNESMLAEIIFLLFEECPELVMIKLSSLKITPMLASSLCQEIDSLQCLDLEGCDIPTSALSIIGTALEKAHFLGQLNLSLCSFTLSDEPILFKMITRNKSLHRIDFYHAGFANDSSVMERGPCFLLNALLQNSTLGTCLMIMLLHF